MEELLPGAPRVDVDISSAGRARCELGVLTRSPTDWRRFCRRADYDIATTVTVEICDSGHDLTEETSRLVSVPDAERLRGR